MFEENGQEMKVEIALLVYAVKSFLVWNIHILEVFMPQSFINRDSLPWIHT